MSGIWRIKYENSIIAIVGTSLFYFILFYFILFYFILKLSIICYNALINKKEVSP